MKQNTVYTVTEILTAAGVNHSDPDFFDLDVNVGGIKVHSADQKILVGEDESVIIIIGSNSYKAEVTE